MTRVWNLYKVLSNVQYGWSAMKYIYVKKRQRLWEPLLIIVGISPLVVMLALGVTWFADVMYRSGMMLAQPHILLAFAALAAQIITLFFGVFYVLSAFYFSNDLKMLIPLPYKPREVLAAKLLTIMTGQYLPILFVFVPAFVLYGVRSQAGLAYWLISVLVLLALPILPLIVSTILSIGLMRVVNRSRRKDLLAVIGGFALTLLIVGFQFYLQFTMPNADPEQLMMDLMQRADGLVELLGRYFPPSVWAAKAMAYAGQPIGWSNFLMFLGVTAASGVVLLAMAQRVFYQGVISGMETGRAGGKTADISKTTNQPLILSLALTEIRLFMRNPGFVLNGLIGYVMFPLMAIMPLFMPFEDDNPFALIADVVNFQFIAGGIALFFVLMSAMSMVPATTFSREGKYLWFARTLPLGINQLLAGRVLAAQIINIAGSILSVVAVAVVMDFPWLAVVIGCVLGILLSTSFAGLLALLDLARPMLNWTNPVKAVKSNLNSMIALAVAVGVAFALGYVMIMVVQVGMGYLVYPLFLFAALLMYGLYETLVERYAQERWKRMES